jgi:hypothetical protein
MPEDTGKKDGLIDQAQKALAIRGFLSDAYSFLRGLSSAGSMQGYGIESALASRIKEISGSPDLNRLGRLEMVQSIKAEMEQAIKEANTIRKGDIDTLFKNLSDVGSGGYVPEVLAPADPEKEQVVEI